MEKDVCATSCVNRSRVERVINAFPEETLLYGATEIFKMLADPNRLRLLHALSQEEMCVCDLAALVEVSDSAVSHQLRLLRTARLVKCRRAGKMVYYRLDDQHVENLLQEGLRHAEEG
ncbi:metalloregulator ArsR/SmtB family transcription factor [Malonomonas rubra]|uniref:ArsR/SmtB family transcription factor n=1 Tax=Malonomonas rubra TaxID=57040 RepID=UPI0026EC00F8|nr:metalloregulator ArsR/SmtB family transcription factor [Malonomonas rubra]